MFLKLKLCSLYKLKRKYSMKKFDYEGMILAKFQGKLFEKSVELNYSTPAFMYRFLHSDLLVHLMKIIHVFSVWMLMMV